MKKQFLRRIFVISSVVIGIAIYQLNYSNVMAQNQVEPTTTITITGTLEAQEQITDTPSPTLVLPNLEVKKEYKITSDINANGNIDPGDKILYTITFLNKGPIDATDLVIRDKLPVQNFELINKEDITKEGSYNGEFIEWSIDKLTKDSANSISYSVTINDQLTSGITDISNQVTILTKGIVLAEARSIFTVNVPTSTPSPSTTPTVTILTPTTGTITATATQVSGASALSGSPLPTWIIFSMAMIGIGVFTYVATIARFKPTGDAEKDQDFLDHRLSVFREGVIIIFIVSAVLLMAISDVLPSDGAISILSAIVGYVFGRAKTGRS